METVLIAGGTGLIGTEIAKILSESGFYVTYLSQKKSNLKNFYYWNTNDNFIDIEAVKNADYIVNLAGANISSSRWSTKYKNLILESRIKSAKLIFNACKENNFRPKAYISASATGYYGTFNSEKIFSEDDPPGKDFLAKICIEWEKSALEFNSINIRTIILRFGVVLSSQSIIFQKIFNSVRKNYGAYLGKGNQYIPWIYIEDLAEIVKFMISYKSTKGIYNCVAPKFITNKDLTLAIAKKLNKKIWLPNIPAFILKIVFGEMSSIMLYGSIISSEKIIKQGFVFKFNDITVTIDKILKTLQ